MHFDRRSDDSLGQGFMFQRHSCSFLPSWIPHLTSSCPDAPLSSPTLVGCIRPLSEERGRQMNMGGVTGHAIVVSAPAKWTHTDQKRFSARNVTYIYYTTSPRIGDGYRQACTHEMRDQTLA